MTRILPITLAACTGLLLAACEPAAAPTPATPNAPELSSSPGQASSPEERLASCNAQSLASYQGASWPRSLPGTIASRVYIQGAAVTMDHRPDRLNVVLNAEGNRVQDIFCG